MSQLVFVCDTFFAMKLLRLLYFKEDCLSEVRLTVLAVASKRILNVLRAKRENAKRCENFEVIRLSLKRFVRNLKS